MSHVFPKVSPVPGCPSIALITHRVYAQGAAGDRGRWAMMEGDYQDPAIIRVHCCYTLCLWLFCVPPSFTFSPAKFNHLDNNFSCKGGLIFDVVSDVRFVSATKQCLNKSGAALINSR